ncbi:MAG TPA: ribonuclease P protein component [Bacteroidia bacterium]|nr:ribonuclease P protein component [Bacteroidia bacterium]
MRHTFQKSERLSGKKIFDTLIKEGNSFFLFPFRVIWMETKEEMPFPARVAFAVPKKNFKKAVDRNHIKRICRESYRRHKAPFYEALLADNRKLNVLFVFLHKSPVELKECDAKIVLTLQRLIKANDGTGDRKKT